MALDKTNHSGLPIFQEVVLGQDDQARVAHYISLPSTFSCIFLSSTMLSDTWKIRLFLCLNYVVRLHKQIKLT